MARMVDQPLWDKLLEAYRANPGNHYHAAQATGVQRKTAKRAWDEGYPTRGPWGAKPIRQLIQEEQEIAASRLQHEQDRKGLEEDRAALEAERDREKARQRAIDARVQEAEMLRRAGSLVTNAMGAAITLAQTQGLHNLMSRLGNSLAALAVKDGDLTAREQAEAMMSLRRYATTLRELSEMGRNIMEMERLHMGEPTQIIGLTDDYDRMPLDELVRLAGHHGGILGRAAERGQLTLIQGGKSTVDAEAEELVPKPPQAPGKTA